jgi:hypothetical protein
MRSQGNGVSNEGAAERLQSAQRAFQEAGQLVVDAEQAQEEAAAARREADRLSRSPQALLVLVHAHRRQRLTRLCAIHVLWASLCLVLFAALSTCSMLCTEVASQRSPTGPWHLCWVRQGTCSAGRLQSCRQHPASRPKHKDGRPAGEPCRGAENAEVKASAAKEGASAAVRGARQAGARLRGKDEEVSVADLHAAAEARLAGWSAWVASRKSMDETFEEDKDGKVACPS